MTSSPTSVAGHRDVPLRVCAGFIFGMSLLLPAVARAGTVNVLDAVGDVGAGASLSIGTDGRGLIAYYDATNGDLKVAHCADLPCTSATLSRIDSTGDVGRHAAVAIGSDGRGIISYFDATNGTLKVAHCDDVPCTTATTSTVAQAIVRGRTSLAVGTDGLALIAFAGPATAIELTRLWTLHCSNVACTTGDSRPFAILVGTVDLDTAVAIGGDGLPVIAYVPSDNVPAPPVVGVLHCSDTACSTGQPQRAPERSGSATLGGGNRVQSPSLAVGADGLPRLAFGLDFAGPGVVINETAFLRCTDAGCIAGERESFSAPLAAPSMAMQASGQAMIAWARTDRLTLARCTDADCVGFAQTCAPVVGSRPSLARGSDSLPLAALYVPATGDLAVAHGIDDSCADPTVGIANFDVTLTEGNTGTQSFTVLFNQSGPAAAPPSVDYATRDGSATAGADYVATSGAHTFGPLAQFISLGVHGDTVDEIDEIFFFDVANPANAVLGTSRMRVTIVDDDPTQIAADDCEAAEGDAGSNTCAITVRISAPSTVPVTVDFATADGTATAGADYLAQSGTLTFTPGTVTRGVTVSVLGDLSVELDETFFVNLTNPSGGSVVIVDGSGEGRIVDDDAPSLSTLELTHGSRIRADLAAAPGPTVDQDLYRLAQGPYSSWEIAVDEVSGDVAPGLLLERLAEDNTTVLQTGVASGTGPARALRWQRRAGTPEVRQHIRVRSASCTTDCGTDDSYRLRAYETTGAIPRFNNSSSQVTVLVLQNATDQSVQAYADFWNASGVLLTTVSVPLAPRAVGLVNTAGLPALAGMSGTITVTHDGPYGAVAGKSVALEPATGFSFDSPMLTKAR